MAANEPWDEFLERWNAALREAETLDCWGNAWSVAKRLDAEGQACAIHRLRDVRETPLGRWHGPLTPLRLGREGLTWTTHYVCVCRGVVYDPVVGGRVGAESYSETAFGRRIPMEEVVGTAGVRAALRTGRIPPPTSFPAEG